MAQAPHPRSSHESSGLQSEGSSLLGDLHLELFPTSVCINVEQRNTERFWEVGFQGAEEGNFVATQKLLRTARQERNVLKRKEPALESESNRKP